ncbi:hypothetical protein DCAR_0831544 [Daucus carota subsp. sativus]|uniref:Uncharacterized protein n=2 Tax=Daucus carota subsp. sativus TaxID=79200 RepID=A0AAF0XTC9_DAUCS|nr:hypothetical protein DCAR_0831544 [Daucus carota subsp. sativus]
MLPFFVLCSVFYTFLTSFILSVVLLIRCTISLLFGFFRTRADDSISLYEGTVCHERRHPLSHSFKMSVRYALIDLDRSSYIPPNHLSAKEARSIAGTKGPVLLLTIPPSVGYQRSPVTLYYCYEPHKESSSDILKYCIAEVSNTPWGEQVRFVFNPYSDLAAKSLHVSPFMDMLGDWKMKTRSPGNNLSVTVSVKHPVLGNYFTASLTAQKVKSSSKVDYALFFWLMPQKAAIYTYWQSFKLLLNNVQFYEHPKYKKPLYIEESLKNAEGRGCCMAFPGTGDLQNSTPPNGCERWYSWKKVKWPWA